MSKEIQVYPSERLPVKEEADSLYKWAHELAKCPCYSKNGVSGVISIILSARELNLPPMACLNGGMNIIKGKIEISPRMMNAMIRKAGHSIKTVESTEECCRLLGKRADTHDVEEVSYTIGDAKKAGLVKQDSGWTKFPADMLYARAFSRLARRLFSDVIGNAYVEGEIERGADASLHTGDIEIREEKQIEEPLLEKECISEEQNSELMAMMADHPEILEKVLGFACREGGEGLSSMESRHFEKVKKRVEKLISEKNKDQEEILAEAVQNGTEY